MGNKKKFGPSWDQCPDKPGNEERHLTKASQFVYDKKPMLKKFLERSFPLGVALFSFVVYQILYHPLAHSLEMTISILMSFAALAWSATIFLSRERWHWLRFLYSVVAVFLSVLLVEVIRFSSEDLLLQRMMYVFNLLVILAIEFYLHILRKEQENTHD
jgi:predicted neutral ceramidase superfamily lipid hydrolase